MGELFRSRRAGESVWYFKTDKELKSKSSVGGSILKQGIKEKAGASPRGLGKGNLAYLRSLGGMNVPRLVRGGIAARGGIVSMVVYMYIHRIVYSGFGLFKCLYYLITPQKFFKD